jgi:hypothetical protein
MVQLLVWSPAMAQSRYPTERDHSPITPAVAQQIKAIAENGQIQGRYENRFIKVGDSITVAPDYFMGQFIYPDHDPNVHHDWDYTRDLGFYQYLRTPMEHFLSGILPGGETSFDRQSLAAQSGMTAHWAITGDPCPLQQEIDAVSPLCAVIMFGTNDVGGWGDHYALLKTIGGNLLEIIDRCIAQGIIPVITAPPLRGGYEEITLDLSHLVRALAQMRQIPFIDYHRAMMPLPDYGLGSDQVHPSVMQYNRMCHLTEEGLQFGYNMRNLVTMQAFDRVYRTVIGEAPALDFEPATLQGEGSLADPFQVDALPFIDARATTTSNLQYTYRLDLGESLDLRLMAIHQDDSDADLTLLDSSLAVIESSEGWVDIHLDSGLYFVVVEAKDGLPVNAGEYQLLIIDRSGDGSPDSNGIVLDGATASPSILDPDAPTVVTFQATALDDSAIAGVFLDLSEVGGGSNVEMTGDGQGAYSYSVSLNPLSSGERLVTVTARDDEANEVSVPIYFVPETGDLIFSDGLESGDTGAWS